MKNIYSKATVGTKYWFEPRLEGVAEKRIVAGCPGNYPIVP